MTRWALPFVAIAALLLPGCDDPAPGPRPTPAPVETGTPSTAPPDTATDLRKQLEAAQKAREDAIGKADRLAQLQAEKDIAEASARLAKAEAADALRRAGEWERQAKDKDAEVAAERTRQQQVWLYWFSGALGVLALVATGIGIWLPLVRRLAWGFAAACAATAALALTAAALLPYLLWVGLTLVAAGSVWVVLELRGSDHANRQAARAIEAAKEHIPNYKQLFRTFYDEATDRRFNRIREHAGLKPRKP